MAKDLIVFGEDWGGLPSSTQQLIKHLSSERKVVWINSIGLRQPQWNYRDVLRAMSKLFSVNKRNYNGHSETQTAISNKHFTVINPKTIPAPRSRWARSLSTWLLRHQTLSAVKRLGCHSPVLWVSLPTAVDMVGQLDESGVVYYCGDDFSALAGVDHETVIIRERELVDCADIVLTASDTLRQKMNRASAVTIEHGVDYALFSNHCAPASDLPNQGRPIAGFYGSISQWLDIELLVAVAQRMTDWDFVFIGESVIDISSLTKLSNVYFLGAKAHELLPRYSQHWQVSLLPFRQNEQINACNPFKLREYLAAGTPVVSTAFPAVEAFGDAIAIVSGAEQMCEAIYHSLNDSQAQKKSRQLLVCEHSWQARASEVAELVDCL
ncbi:glycosyltransferase [Psychrobium sp. 1_MG-2023]|uniref:glycosyltransferase n=1 Tax=Psychrobium sp. 1_MG-2023 TaxID=3062624 RepID=UPI000C34082D|nr:glycosyltransferase [Psychrobium sp. 1_MG-2023]MDP2561330.1 glycosyltransferase [Psychrobium sp. 1_MG-2023]PKF54144.1 glycosyl transferase [Alteromonadales bacterium alter-6D02]